jgi:hypothetical protein
MTSTSNTVKPDNRSKSEIYDETNALQFCENYLDKAFTNYLEGFENVNQLIKLCDDITVVNNNFIRQSSKKSRQDRDVIADMMGDIAVEFNEFKNKCKEMIVLLKYYKIDGYMILWTDEVRCEFTWCDGGVDWFIYRKLDPILKFNQDVVWFLDQMKNTNKFPEFVKKYESYQFPTIDIEKYASGHQLFIDNGKGMRS